MSHHAGLRRDEAAAAFASALLLGSLLNFVCSGVLFSKHPTLFRTTWCSASFLAFIAVVAIAFVWAARNPAINQQTKDSTNAD